MVKKAATNLQWQIILPLAALGLVRTLMHIFRVVEIVPATEGLAWLGTATVWVAFVLSRGLPRPFLTLVFIGGIYGILSAFVQQIFWSSFWAGYPPVEVGSLAWPIDSPSVRTIAIISSVVTGLGWGILLGVVAILIRKPPAAPKRRKK